MESPWKCRPIAAFSPESTSQAASSRLPIIFILFLRGAQAERVARVDALRKRLVALDVGELVDLADPVVDHGLGAVVPGVVERGRDQRLRQRGRGRAGLFGG